jgi:hypothetical protein
MNRFVPDKSGGTLADDGALTGFQDVKVVATP